MSLKEWQGLWDEFYALKASIGVVNEKLVACKIRLRSTGVPTPQPPAPRPVASKE